MAHPSTSNTPAVVPTTTSDTQPNAEQMKVQVAVALSTLDNLYKENINSYAQELHACTRKIENAQAQLEQLLNEKKPHTLACATVQKEIDYELRLLERLSQEWNQQSMVVYALESELSQLNHSAEERKQILKSRSETLEKLQSEIDDIELTLLEHELQKQNVLLIVEPIERHIVTLQQSIKELESEKRYIESSHLHQLSPSAKKPQVEALTHTNNPIDVETIND